MPVFGGGVRVLNQDEIDSLLGFDIDRDEEEELELRNSSEPLRITWQTLLEARALRKEIIRRYGEVGSYEYYPIMYDLDKKIDSLEHEYQLILKMSRYPRDRDIHGKRID